MRRVVLAFVAAAGCSQPARPHGGDPTGAASGGGPPDDSLRTCLEPTPLEPGPDTIRDECDRALSALSGRHFVEAIVGIKSDDVVPRTTEPSVVCDTIEAFFLARNTKLQVRRCLADSVFVRTRPVEPNSFYVVGLDYEATVTGDPPQPATSVSVYSYRVDVDPVTGRGKTSDDVTSRALFDEIMRLVKNP